MKDLLGIAEVVEKLGKILHAMINFDQTRRKKRMAMATAILEACAATRVLTNALENDKDSAADGKIDANTVGDLWVEAAKAIAPYDPELHEEFLVKAFGWKTGVWDHEAYTESPIPRQVEYIMAQALKIVPNFEETRFINSL